ncbi:MAG: hypothetical protein JMN25_18660 [gamma proteobacterium endosymbiont of Lamellibrachia anaximandri]|nr:hypothetical protein [gamma proteobacterium endosymbiont of Lamellibrachia anaximandri]
MYIISDHQQWFSCRGLAPHKFIPMLGVHNHMHSDSKKRRSSFLVALLFAAGDVRR